MFLAFTTVAGLADAERLATSAVEARLAACVQIDGPLQSLYRWEGAVERTTEYRLVFKCLPAQLSALEHHVLGRHPYATPEWIAVRAEAVGEKYLSWARSDLTHPPL
ncbi:divalent-cation tolerance protein CutA [Horticoccus luteus]|uniref:Divalent-cation tolerance protein CutA n=1 Tax=Horticoccus luteus TaxID=2862869 RepID=A0A8F9TZ21_9BACT|nr:divalent-cation tolerance protein CutA [Horticoccus luteus]QYM80147.1 divalent-cation tolerance protein CutA [Horticoccus luteus]